MAEPFVGCRGGHGRATLRGFREACMLTQQQVADRLAVTRQTVAAWESGARRPDVADLAALARVYRVRVEDLAEASDD